MSKIKDKISKLDYQLILNYNLKSFIIYCITTFVIVFVSVYLLFFLAEAQHINEDQFTTSLIISIAFGFMVPAVKYNQHLELKEYLAFYEEFNKLQKEFKDCFNLDKLNTIYESLMYDVYPKYYIRRYFNEINSFSEIIIERIKCIQKHPEINETK